ncbi:PEBP-like protein [Aureobasidium sp. EXF-3400]|nr:PEBP-like protein [Aureobasidium sp. EXF-12344]KAI4775882.1 PEBP-like protein [Aureobasidium sp. EXF-3400]
MLLNMLARYFVLSVLAERVVCAVLPHQEILTRPAEKDPNAIIAALRQAEIIPDVLNTFSPLLSITMNWSSTAETELGNTLPPFALTHPPDVYSAKIASAYWPEDIEFVLALTDPDAPSRSDPKWSQVCHMLFTLKKGVLKEYVDYKPPGPPEGTGKHRYVFVVMIASNGTTEALNLETPDERRHWGYEGDRSGVREFAKKHGLKVIAANFIYSQNDKQ